MQFSPQCDTVIVLKVNEISPKALKHNFRMSRRSKKEIYKNSYTHYNKLQIIIELHKPTFEIYQY